MRTISAKDARRLLHGGGEVAFLDVREAGEFGEGHPLFAVPCPYSRLELDAPRLFPRPTVPVILIDGGDGVARRAAARLEGLGYTDVAIVDGGTPGWATAGLTLYKGVNVPGKVLGELVEEAVHVPTITARTLAAWRAEGRRFRLFDARPPAEYAKMRVPGAVCLPNGELAHRFDAAVGDGTTQVVVTCAGRTRGLIGVAGLALAGIGNPVHALENGTQGWALAGETLERGNTADPFPGLDEDRRAASGARAEALSRRHGIPWLDPDGLAHLAADRDRTLFLLDIRSAPEFAAATVAGAVHAPAGQVVQAADQWIGVRRARVALLDDTGLRAALTAFWLRQMGFEAAHVVPGVDRPEVRQALENALPVRPAFEAEPLPEVAPRDAVSKVAAGATLLDLRPSRDHDAMRVPGSLWSIRPRLAADLAGRAGAVLILAGDAGFAALAAKDLAEGGITGTALIEGGIEAWRAAGGPVEAGHAPLPEAVTIDFLRFVHDRHDGNLDASRRYLEWETGLVAQLDAEERAEFALAL